jgi:menaquinone-9 beta-reductase
VTAPRSTELYDVCIVGAGPVGATCAWYLARQRRRVLLLDKARFPRDKLCGDAVTSSAQIHLDRMGVLPALLAANEGRGAAAGGFVSPSGARAMGTSAPRNGRSLVIAIKRVVLDQRLACAAADAGAELVEQSPVASAEFSASERAWTISVRDRPPRQYRARVLIAADGALSRLARSLGLVTTPPEAVCSRAYARAGTDRCVADGLVFYPRSLLPGYCGVVREADGELNFCCYVIPGGETALTDLRAMHERLVRADPHVSTVLGPDVVIDPMRAAPLRLGGVPRSYADHCLVVGDAAGHIDPLTGEGIQYGMDAAEIAAGTLDDAFQAGDWSARRLRPYQERWMRAFGRDFRWSRLMALACARHPGFLDASAAVVQRRGAEFLTLWAEIMTGVRPKRSLLAPGVVLPLAAAIARQWWTGGGGVPPTPVPETPGGMR